MTASRWTELERLAKAATPGPWEWREDFDPLHMRTLSPGILVLDNDPGCGGPWGDSIDRANAAFIAAASPTTVLELLAENEALREQVGKGAG